MPITLATPVVTPAVAEVAYPQLFVTSVTVNASPTAMVAHVTATPMTATGELQPDPTQQITRLLDVAGLIAAGSALDATAEAQARAQKLGAAVTAIVDAVNEVLSEEGITQA